MAVNLSNVYPISDTFDTWITKTNIGLGVISTVAVTTSPNTVGGYTSGNAYVDGIFSANTLVAVDGIRGGSVTDSGVLTLLSSVDSQLSFINVFTTAANVVITGSGKTMNIAVPTTVNANLATAPGVANVFIAGTNADIQTTKLNIVSDFAVWNIAGTGTKLFNVVSSSNTGAFNLETLNTVANSITSNVTTAFTVNGSGNIAFRAANTTIGNTSVYGLRVTNDGTTTTTTIGGNVATIAANLSITAAQANIASVTVNTANTTLAGAGNLSITTANVNITSNVYFTGANVTFGTSANFANVINQSSDFVSAVVANSDIGTGTLSAINVYSYDKTLYSAAEITAVAKNGGSTQIQKMLIVDDGSSNVYSTVYGTVAAPNTANVGIFSTTVVGSNVVLKFQQTLNNSAVKLKIDFIK